MDQCHDECRSKSPLWRQSGTNIFSALSSANAATLNTPRIALAAMVRDQDAVYGFYLRWLQDQPSIDGAELYFSKTNPSVKIAVTEFDIRQNKRDSEVSVVFAVPWTWSKTNDIWSKLENISDVADLKVRLLKAGEVKTGWCPITFYRFDNRMGTHTITEVKAGTSRPSVAD